MSARDYFAQPRFADFMLRAAELSWSEAVKEYRDISGDDIVTGTAVGLVAQELARRS